MWIKRHDLFAIQTGPDHSNKNSEMQMRIPSFIILNPDYAEIATRRIEHEHQQMPLLEAIK